MDTTQLLTILHWLTNLSLEADGVKSLSSIGFQDDMLGAFFGQLSHQCMQMRMYLLTTRCSQERQDRFWEQRVAAVFEPLPETYLVHIEELERLRLEITPTPPPYKIRLLGKAFDLFSLNNAILINAYDEEVYGRMDALFKARDRVRDAIKGNQQEAYEPIHEKLDWYASTIRPLSPVQVRWDHFATIAAQVVSSRKTSA